MKLAEAPVQLHMLARSWGRARGVHVPLDARVLLCAKVDGELLTPTMVEPGMLATYPVQHTNGWPSWDGEEILLDIGELEDGTLLGVGYGAKTNTVVFWLPRHEYKTQPGARG